MSKCSFRNSSRKTGVSRTVTAIVILVIIGLAAVYLSSLSFSPGKAAVSSISAMSQTEGPLVLYVADAYAQEGQTLLQAFSSQTAIPTAPPKAAGSLVLARQIAQGNPVSVFMPVSQAALRSTYLGNQSSGWAIAFAGDEMTLAYTNMTQRNAAASVIVADYAKASSSNSSKDWYSFFNDLSSGAVRVGIADPNADPAGYRGWLVLEAAGGAYANNSAYFVKSLRSNGGNVTGSSAANLIAPLEAGQIQFLFIYRSAAASHGLNYLRLPDAVNFGNPSRSSFYGKFGYNIKSGVERGSPILLFVTVPRDSTDYFSSIQFVVFVVHNAHSLLQGYHLTILAPARLYNSTSVPSQISSLIREGSLTHGGNL